MEQLGRVLCIITGASRGFGRTVAKEMARLVKPRSVFIVVARSGDELRTLKAELAESDLEVRCVVVDLSLTEAPEMVVRAAKEASSPDIEHLILVNNAASLGDVSRFTKSFTSMAEVNAYLSSNVSSALCLTASVLQAFPEQSGLRRCVINISSLCALKPFCSWVLYCTGKAAREMMFKVLAEEEPDLRVLNYAPGTRETVPRSNGTRTSLLKHRQFSMRRSTIRTCLRCLVRSLGKIRTSSRCYRPSLALYRVALWG
ncbi:sepiapterin reductase-like isoform X1 [Festucalex cinctus]